MCGGGHGQDLAFHSTLRSAEHGELLVEGVVTGKAVEGTGTWSKPDQAPIVPLQRPAAVTSCPV
jgi:hypothetical protein